MVTGAILGAVAASMPAGARSVGSGHGRFPEGFLWGAATAAYQTEGNNISSDIWPLEHAQPTTYKEPSGDAANSFFMWATDMDIVKALGLTSYRFSLEWGRIEPVEGQFSVAMLDHYKAMIAGCRARGLTPIVTFNHFTVPIWFAAKGGWMSDEAPALFARYCDRAARHLGEQIGYALTLNEPNLSGMLAMLLPKNSGESMLRRDREMSEAVARTMGVPLYLSGNALYLPDPDRVQHNLRSGHKAGRDAIKSVCPNLPVGVSLAMNDDQAAGPGSMRDLIRDKLYDRWLDAVRGDDFVGVQNYWRAVWDADHRLPAPAGVETDDEGQEIYPASLANSARYAHGKSGCPVLITEHGVNTKDDAKRQRFIPAALAELHTAMHEGIPVLGYTHWALIDNWEWFFGFKPQYGLCSFNRETFERTPKKSAKLLGTIAARNAL
jgi:beta-glucosidase